MRLPALSSASPLLSSYDRDFSRNIFLKYDVSLAHTVDAILDHALFNRSECWTAIKRTTESDS